MHIPFILFLNFIGSKQKNQFLAGIVSSYGWDEVIGARDKRLKIAPQYWFLDEGKNR